MDPAQNRKGTKRSQTYCLNGRRLQISGPGEHFLGSFSAKPKGESDDKGDDEGGEVA